MQSAFPALVTVLALFFYAWATVNVSRMRVRHGVQAPAVTGPPEFERAFRVHQNTQEQLVLFLPALWLFVMLLSPVWGGVIGLAWIAGRVLYATSYLRNLDTRGPEFAITGAASVTLLIGALVGAIVNLR
jgi:glutathione S-transferase